MDLKKWLFLVLTFLCQSVFGQSPYHYVIDKAKGLPSNNVYDVYQDSKGFIWLSTNEGICRYDGLKFTSYQSDKQTSRSGSSIKEDKYGRIWYSNFDGYLYYVADGKLQTLDAQAPRGYFSFGIIEDNLYTTSKDGIAVYALKTLKLIKQIALADRQIYYSYAAHGKFYVLGSTLYEFSSPTAVKKIKLPPAFFSTVKNAVIIQKLGGSLLFASKNAPFYFIYDNNQFKKLERSTHLEYVQNISQTNNQLWLCTSTGAFLSNNISGALNNYNQYFPEANISSVFKDNRENYWFATLNKGIMLVPEFKNIMLAMPSRPIRIVNDKKGIVVSTEDESIYKVDMEKLTTKPIYKGSGNHSINQLVVDTLTNEVIFTSNTFTFLDASYKITNLVYVAVKDVRKVDDKYYTFAASGYCGLFTNAPNLKSEWDSIFKNKLNAAGKFGEATLISNVNGKATIYNPVNKTIYYATNIGLFSYGLLADTELKYQQQSLFLRDFSIYKDEVYGLSTNGKIYTINIKNQIEKFQIDQKIGIVSKIKVKDNILYIFASTSVYEYDLQAKKFRTLISLGSDYEVSDVAFYQNKMVFATAKGLLLPAKDSNKAKFYTTLVLDNITVNDSLVNTKSLTGLHYTQNNININYALLAYAPTEKSPVYYKIGDQKWRLLDEYSRSLKLNALSPGSYVVSFRTQSEKGPKIDTISFVINKPFWLTHLFIICLISLFLVSIYLLHRYKLAQNDKRNEMALAKVNLENSLNQSKLKAIKSQMNPHFFYNALNTIQSYILANDKKQAVTYLSKFSVLTRTILEMSEKEYISLPEEIKTISVYLDIEKARFDEDFDYEISCEDSLNTEDIKIPTMLLQPYLENAIKHGLLHKVGAKKLEITFSKDKSVLSVTIDDNGIGRKKSKELNKIKQDKHQSFATNAMQNRVELLNQNKINKISIRYVDKVSVSEHALGTTVIIQIPIAEH